MKANSARKHKGSAQRRPRGTLVRRQKWRQRKSRGASSIRSNRALSRSATRWYMMLGLAAGALVATCATKL